MKTLINTRLKELRKAKKFSINALSKAIGISNWALQNWESRGFLPNTKFLVVLADFYGVSIDYILYRTENPKINH